MCSVPRLTSALAIILALYITYHSSPPHSQCAFSRLERVCKLSAKYRDVIISLAADDCYFIQPYSTSRSTYGASSVSIAQYLSRACENDATTVCL